jgi:hypothetical protein
MRCRRSIMTASLLALGMMLSGCETFDPSDWFNQKKPLPGERKPVFPGGVPGVPQGVPPELIEGNRQQSEEPKPQVAETPAEKPKPAAAPKPRQPKPAAAPPSARQAAPATASSTAISQPASPWPSPPQQTSQPAASQAPSPFPDPPRPGTVSR